MNLYTSIGRRKSCRQYDMQPLEPDLLRQIEAVLQGFTPLDSGFSPRYRFTKKVKGKFHVEAPHYLVAERTGAPRELENTGFYYQQLGLWLNAMELGCVWLGASRDTQAKNAFRADIITIGFGRATEPAHRTPEQFKRKPIGSITNAPDDACIRAAHLAPSGMNLQPWYFEKQGSKVLVYKQKLKPPVSLLYRHTDIDMGIALCHYWLACQQAGKPFRFSRNTDLPGKAGYLSFGSIE